MSASLIERLTGPFQKLVGKIYNPFRLIGVDNGYVQRAMNAAGTDQIDLYGTDSSNRLLLGGSYQNPIGSPRFLRLQTSAKDVTTAFFLTGNATSAPPAEITRIDCIFSVANGAAMTAYVSKETVGQAPGAGATCMSGTFNLNATANTLQTATLAGTRGYPSLVLNPGEQLSLKISTTVTSIAGLTIVVWLRPHVAASHAGLALHANGDIATQTFYLNIVSDQVISNISMRWGTAGTNGGTVTADVTKDTSTAAPGAGTSVLLAAQSVKTAANTTVFPALAASTATLTMASGDRLALKMTGTLTALADLVVNVVFLPTLQNDLVLSLPTWDAVATDRTLFIANTWYAVEDFWATWSAVGGSGATVTITKDTGTTAPGAGTALLTGAIDLTATANTPVEGTLIAVKPTLILAPGDRLGLHNAGTVGTLAGMIPTVRIRRL